MTIPRLKTSRYWVTLLLSALIAVLCALLWPPGRLNVPILAPINTLEWNGYDALFALRGPTPKRIDPRIVIVGFDDETESRINHRWPPPRSLHAQVIRNLLKSGVRLIVFDTLFTDASNPEDDKALNAALAEAGNKVVLASKFNYDASLQSRSFKPPYFNDTLGIDFEGYDPVTDTSRTYYGFAEIPTDEDTRVRRSYPALYHQGHWIPSLSAAAYLALNNAKLNAVRAEPAAANPDPTVGPTYQTAAPTAIVLADRNHVPCTGPQGRDDRPGELGQQSISVSPYLPSVYLDFPAGVASFPILSYDRLAQQPNPDVLHGAIVFIGVTGDQLMKETMDWYETGYSHYKMENQGARTTRRVPGVVVQAQILNAYLNDGYLRLAPAWSVFLIVFVFALATTSLARLFLDWRGPALLLVCVGLYTLATSLLFSYGHLHLPWVFPNLLILLGAGTIVWVERGRMQRKWAGYVSPAVMQIIMRQEMAGAERYDASVIFGDVRSFTSFSEKHEPETVVALLNQHFEKLTDITYANGGTIDKFFGDGIMIVMGAPLPMPDAAVRAVRISWQMCEAALKPVRDGDGNEYVLATGFGVATGPFVAGHVGSRRRHEYTVIGDTVNLSSRLQGVTGQPDVIIDQATYDLVRDHVSVEPLGDVTLKGKAQPVTCYKVTEWRD